MATVATKEFFGSYRGNAVHKYRLRNQTTGIQISVMEFGATLISVQLPEHHQNRREITLHFDTLDDYLSMKPGATYLGSTVGRYANRILQGELSIAGKSYQLAINNGPNHLHGGNVGFAHRLWDSRVLEGPHGDAVVFSLVSEDGDENYPGELRAEVKFELTSHDIIITEDATCSALSVCNLTNHAFWNLSGKGKIHDHYLRLYCSRFLPVDSTLIPTGEMKDVLHTEMDFTQGKLIGQDIEKVGGYDHCFIISPSLSPSSFHSDSQLPLFAELKKDGITMKVYTDKPGVQFYTGNFLQPFHDSSGQLIHDKHWGLCLETQFFPDSPHHTQFPSVSISPGCPYHHVTIHQFLF